jgi:DNA-binding MarR family transcriptional regulator
MSGSAGRELEACNCQALRQAARHVSSYYDRYLAPTGLRVSQFVLLSRLQRHGPTTIGALAELLVMDRTTLGRNVRPLERDGLIAVMPGQDDRRSRELRVTAAGDACLARARTAWAEAQAGFERAFGRERTQAMRSMMRDLTDLPLGGGPLG